MPSTPRGTSWKGTIAEDGKGPMISRLAVAKVMVVPVRPATLPSEIIRSDCCDRSNQPQIQVHLCVLILSLSAGGGALPVEQAQRPPAGRRITRSCQKFGKDGVFAEHLAQQPWRREGDPGGSTPPKQSQSQSRWKTRKQFERCHRI